MLYALMRQAVDGDASLDLQPWSFQVEARARYDQWFMLRGMSQFEAMVKFMELIGKADADWINSPILNAFPNDYRV